MATWLSSLNADPQPWLLEEDSENPSLRYFALRDLLEKSAKNKDVRDAQRAIMESGPVPMILEAQDPEGFWVKPGGGYSPKYQGTIWQILLLAELGADPGDEQIKKGCEYLLSHSIASNGAFSALPKPVPSGVIPCLNGNMLYALLKLGYGTDDRVKAAIEWQVQAITGEGDFQYLKSGTTGPKFACSANDRQPCAWGANKVLRALTLIPEKDRTSTTGKAIQTGVEGAREVDVDELARLNRTTRSSTSSKGTSSGTEPRPPGTRRIDEAAPRPGESR